jgi:hypothetical protein
MTILLTGRDSVFPGKVRETADPSASLGMTKGKGIGCTESGGWTEAFLITLDGPQAHDSSGRDYKFVEPFAVFSEGCSAISLQQICHLDRNLNLSSTLHEHASIM